jgi:hypothetical protein
MIAYWNDTILAAGQFATDENASLILRTCREKYLTIKIFGLDHTTPKVYFHKSSNWCSFHDNNPFWDYKFDITQPVCSQEVVCKKSGAKKNN